MTDRDEVPVDDAFTRVALALEKSNAGDCEFAGPAYERYLESAARVSGAAVSASRRTGATGFIRQVVSATVYRPDGTSERKQAPAVWTLAHRGASGSGRLNVWAYPTKASALKAGATLAMECGLDADPAARELMESGQHSAVMRRYEETSYGQGRSLWAGHVRQQGGWG